MSVLKDGAACCGCGACARVCPVGAIQMVPDEEGFLVPEVSQEMCIKCDECNKVCVFDKATTDKKYEQAFYAARVKESEILFESSSGGMFSALSDWVLSQGGVIFGAVYTNDCEVVHNMAKTKDERDKQRGAKYVQSNIGDSYKQIEKILKDGNKVMFTGTPCQIAAMKSWLQERNIYSGELYTMDFICHGVASPKLLKSYCEFIENVSKQKIANINMRSKIYGWRKQKARIEYETGNEHLEEKYEYNQLYLSCLGLRESCYRCPYTSYDRYSDITVGDFWGISPKSPMDDDKGVSTVIINSEKGQKWFSAIKEKLDFVTISKEKCYQRNLEHPTKRPPYRDIFFQSLKEHGIEYIFSKYAGKDTLLPKVVKKIAPLVRRAGLYKTAYKVYGRIFGR